MSLNSFPQEIIDEIITQVRYRDTLLTLPTKRDLLHTSLVSRKWVRQSQKMLYQEVYVSWRRVDLRGRDTPQCATYIRHLSLQFNKWVVFPLKAVEDFIPRLKSFRNMRALTLSVINMKRFSEPNIAVHFPSGLTALNLHKCHLKISTFVAFFSFLPVIREFRARKITLSGRAVIPTKPLPKSLIVLGIYPGYQTQQDIIFPLFTARSLAYQEMRFAGNVTVGHIRPLITASTRTLERLSLPTLPTSDVLHDIGLSECLKLRELSLNLYVPRVEGSAAVNILTSALPPLLSKITMKLQPSKYAPDPPEVDLYQMEVLDNALYTCAQALGPRGLEVSFIGKYGKSVECHLHKFKELGVVVPPLEQSDSTFL